MRKGKESADVIECIVTSKSQQSSSPIFHIPVYTCGVMSKQVQCCTVNIAMQGNVDEGESIDLHSAKDLQTLPMHRAPMKHKYILNIQQSKEL